jgi:hypothetical protein
MDGLRFVLEAPQLSQTHKKRPRLVTSCDNWCVARSCLALVELLIHPSIHPSLHFFQPQPSEENQVCSDQVPGPLRSMRGW